MKRLYLLLFISVLMIGGCEKILPKTRLKINVDDECWNKVGNNKVTFRVKKVGGGYDSGNFFVPVGEGKEITIELPSGGPYNIKGFGEGKGFFGLVSDWEMTKNIKENQLNHQGFTCSKK